MGNSGPKVTGAAGRNEQQSHRMTSGRLGTEGPTSLEYNCPMPRPIREREQRRERMAKPLPNSLPASLLLLSHTD